MTLGFTKLSQIWLQNHSDEREKKSKLHFIKNETCIVPDAGKDWRQKEKKVAEDETATLHQWLDGQESEQTPGDTEEQGSLACCSPWGRKELYTT